MLKRLPPTHTSLESVLSQSPDSDSITDRSNRAMFILHQWSPLLAYVIPVLLLLLFRFLLPANICDDAFISFKTASNLADGNGIVFNLGEKIYVITSPLWVFLLAIVRTLTSNVVLAAKYLGTFFEVLLLLSIVHLGHTIMKSRASGMLAAILICTNPVFLLTSFSGMELSLYLFLILLSLNLLAYERYTGSLIVAAITIWVRFDGLLIYTVVLVWTLYLQRHEIMYNSRKVLFKFLPSFAVISSYILFGLIYYGNAIPTSVQRKVQMSPPFFSETWIEGTRQIFVQFTKAFLGKSYWLHPADTPLWLLVIPLMIGLIRIVIKKKERILPLLVFTLLYAFSFIVTGNRYAINFPWYFVPVLPGLYLPAAWGCIELLSLFTRRLTSFPRLVKQGVVLTLVIAIWTLIMLDPIKQDAEGLSISEREREQAYAAAIVWLGKHLEKNTIVAASEIGAIGFFSRPDISILDMFGILRKKEELSQSYIDLFRKYHPEAVLTLQIFRERKRLEKKLGNAYIWLKFRRLNIGLRSDLASTLRPNFHELTEIYETMVVGKEYHWSM